MIITKPGWAHYWLAEGPALEIKALCGVTMRANAPDEHITAVAKCPDCEALLARGSTDD